ncbi:class I SAM-dependent methyltransferase [Flavobacterium sp. NRK F10]|uniref:class I SAM-dependent methyltransferase n=1 Tax=Flavobacterium sp. NRK F10 TaxID=2954931 RepID=UPI002090DDAE|nr:class I SAM-dependent methyltransferase [Flavobacterium sp. NRK F10]MCO6175959.1 class I SAM-dependent methyltransferase [Flavobacterium sp. NRK F10]
MNYENYFEINKQTWNTKVPVHIDSDFYDMEGFLNGKNTLPDLDLKLLGDVSGKKILHLQCHFGQDSLSLARMGAQVTGIDISDKAIEEARKLNDQLGLDARFICCNVYDTPEYVKEQFDIVYTSYGVIGWLPDLNKWAEVISKCLKPGGKLVFVEFHPVVWMFDDDFTKVNYHYHNERPIIESYTGTYAQKEADIKTDYVGWNHSLAEVLTALLQNGLTLTDFQEFDYSPYNCFNKTIEFEKGKYRIQHLENKIPMLYSLIVKK